MIGIVCIYGYSCYVHCNNFFGALKAASQTRSHPYVSWSYIGTATSSILKKLPYHSHIKECFMI